MDNYGENVVANNPKERLEKFAHEVLVFYNDLHISEQVEFFCMLREKFALHRHGMLQDLNSDMKAMDERRQQMEKGAEVFKINI